MLRGVLFKVPVESAEILRHGLVPEMQQQARRVTEAAAKVTSVGVARPPGISAQEKSRIRQVVKTVSRKVKSYLTG